MDCDVAPVLHTLPLAALDVKVVDAPVQKEVIPEITGMAGNGFTVTVVISDVTLHPFPLATVTE